MTPLLLKNCHRVHDFVTNILKERHGTFKIKGPFFANLDLLATSDPANVNYILNKNFSNYPKGPEFHKIFEIFGDGMLNVDAHLWEVQRKTNISLFKRLDFNKMLQEIIKNKVRKGLIPVLDNVSEQEIEVDLQEIFQRLTFDNICSLLLDHDPESLSLGLPYIPCEKAFPATEEALLYRHVLPESIWKLQSWIGLGKEKSLSKAWEAFDKFIYKCIFMKRKELLNRNTEQLPAASREVNKLDLLGIYMEAYKDQTADSEKFLRDSLLALMIAGRDTTSTTLTWFFWLLSRNPLVESKIQKEIETELHPLKAESWKFLDERDNLRKLVYLHAALCETLRLYPPIALQHMAPINADILPSGHAVDKNSKILLSFYSMGRMENIWGDDCLEFKPERWINEQGGIQHVPSYKFPAFNAGPRSCIGKEMAFTQMKTAAVTIIHNYRIKVVEGHPIVPADSIVLQMKYGLKVKLARKQTTQP
ncbi:alkane hydroxylase MAH1-like [Apium graveolens]|uniref:alkane hydroxylase MAH1-like n=1 Tax=Apium graveolens TaxID=4045 RepID=UPI003D794410